MSLEYIDVNRIDYLSFLKWVDETTSGYQIYPVPIADKTMIMCGDFPIESQYPRPIANRYLPIYNSPETYTIRSDVYDQWLRSSVVE